VQVAGLSLGLHDRPSLALRADRLRSELHQVAGDTGGVVAGDAGFFQIVPRTGITPRASMASRSATIWQAPSSAYLALSSIGNGRAVDQRVVEDLLAGVAVESADVIGGGEAEALVGLRHQVADVDLGGGRVDDGFGDAVHQQVWDEAGEQRAGADADDVGAGDGVERLRQRIDIGGNEEGS
jgi:hypothetical protein